jgi:ABC-type dipeptide/oligopeptide/nickel transport system permease component
MATKKTTIKRLPRMQNSDKKDSFAIGVSPSHYWMITAMAQIKESNRMHMLDEIIEHYIRTVLASGSTK